MASISSTAGHQEGQLPDAPAREVAGRWGEASSPRFSPGVETMLAIVLLLSAKN